MRGLLVTALRAPRREALCCLCGNRLGRPRPATRTCARCSAVLDSVDLCVLEKAQAEEVAQLEREKKGVKGAKPAKPRRS